MKRYKKDSDKMSSKFHIGDKVIIITGKDRGKSGKILKIVNDKVLIEGLNIIKKCVKPNPNKDEPGGIVDKPAFIHISNVAIHNPDKQKSHADKITYAFKEKNGKLAKVRTFRSNGNEIGIES